MPSKKPGGSPKSVDLTEVFHSLQDSLLADLKVPKSSIGHPGTKGTVTENRWRKMLEQHLPKRYCATDAFVVDSTGRISDQIDVVIYDSHYSPFILNEDGAKYITAESVYAVIEIKQRLTAADIEYASKKIASVRSLHRTSAKIPHAAGTHKPKPLTHIIGGIMTRDCAWPQASVAAQLENRLAKLSNDKRIDIGCVLVGGSFDVSYGKRSAKVTVARPETALVFFLLRLLGRLQALGTVAAIDLNKYSERL